MSSLCPVPSFATGFARNASQSLFPSLWKDLTALWAPSLGIQGDRWFDFSGFRNDGSFQESLFSDSWIPEENGYAVDFEGFKRIDVLNDSSLNFGTGPFSIVSMVKNSTGAVGVSRGTIVHKRNTSSPFNQYHLWTNKNTGKITLFTFDGSTSSVEGNVDVRVGWHQIAGTRSLDGTLSVYADGSLDNSSLLTVRNVDNPSGLKIGRFATGSSDYQNGIMGNIYMYKRKLLPQEIALLYAIPQAPLILKDDLMAFLVAGRLSRYHDLSGIGSQGQMTWNPLG